MGNIATVNLGPVNYAAPASRQSRRSLLKWAVGAVVIGGMGISVLLPSLCKAREPANRIKCASNLKQIGLAIGQYAQQNGGHYPPSLAVLLKQEDITTDVMQCPSTSDERATVAELEAAETHAPGHKQCLSYVYVGSTLTENTALATTVVAYEPLDNHKETGTNVLFGDGHVDWIDQRAWPKLAAQAGVTMVPSQTTTP